MEKTERTDVCSNYNTRTFDVIAGIIKTLSRIKPTGYRLGILLIVRGFLV